MKMIGVERLLFRWRMSDAVSKPSIPGHVDIQQDDGGEFFVEQATQRLAGRN